MGSPGFPWEVMRGIIIGTGPRGCTECIWGLAGMGVRMGMVDMDDRPIDRFGKEPIPVQRKHTGEHEEIKSTASEDRQTFVNNNSKMLGCKRKY